jgi:hypothetical protein
VFVGRIVVDTKVKRRTARKIVGLLEVLFLLLVLAGGGALWLMAIRVPETSSPPAAASEPGTASIKLVWDKSPGPNVTGYKILIGLHPGDYVDTVSVGNEGTVTLTQLKKGTRYYLVVVAVDAAGNQSVPTNEVEVLTPD